MKDASPPRQLLFDGPARSALTLVLAHGAGAGMKSDFMQAFAEALAKQGIRVCRFEFPYMAERSAGGKRRPPDREPVLRQTWLEVIAQIKSGPIFIGGKSMSGRIASLIADEAQVSGLVCLGYPFHPTGKPDQLRISHLQNIQTPTLIVQGERDPFGNKQEVKQFKLSKSVAMHWLPDGDHSFKPRKSSGRREAENWAEGSETIAQFVTS